MGIRHILWVSIIAATCQNSLWAQERNSGRKYAIVIGVERYDPNFFNTLRYAEDDALELGRTLEDLGYVVIVMTNKASIPAHNPTTSDKILNQLAASCGRVRKEDTLIVFLAGHGVLFKKQPSLPDGSRESYFCPEEANLNQLSSLVPMTRVMDIVSKSPAERKLLIVDACRNEAESDLFRSKGTDLGTVGLTPRTVPKGMLALFSCAETEKSVEHPDLQHGVFTYHIIKYLRGDGEGRIYPRDQVSLVELANYARRETSDFVYRKLNRDQSPVLKSPTEVIDWSLGTLQRSLIVNSIDMKLRRIAVGEFMMGNEDSVDNLMRLFPYAEKSWFEDAAKQHRVRITKPFYLGQFEVTVGQFRKFVNDTDYKTEAESDGKGGYGFDLTDGTGEQDPKYNWRNPGFPQEDDHPVVNVSWNDATQFCQWLSRKEGKTYRLPTEAEWEYACRAGETTRYSYGSDPEGLAAVGNVADATGTKKFGWKNAIRSDDGHLTTSAVGSFRENSWGLYDMHGNVWEWCQDWYGDYPSGTVSDPTGPTTGSFRVNRGGGWSIDASSCRSAYRSGSSPGNRFNDLGFRVALVPGR